MKDITELTILVVDDEPDLGELVAFEFELIGANVLNASNGKEAFEKIKSKLVDVVVSDIRMPGGDGVELLENLRAKDPSSPALVFMTGFADIALEDAYDKGAVAVFGKPFNRKELIETVSKSVLPCHERWGAEMIRDDHEFKVQLEFDSLSEAHSQHKFNIGRGGLFFAVEDRLPSVSDTIYFHVKLPGEAFSSIEGEGVVRWVRRQLSTQTPKGIGVEIKNVVGKNREKVIDYWNSLKCIAYIPKS